MKIVNRVYLCGTGNGSATVTIPPQNGLIVGRSLTFDSPAAGTLVVYAAKSAMVANAAVAAGTTLVVKTDASGYIEGAVISTSDYILAFHPTTGAATLSSVSSVAAVSSSTVSLGLGSAITCSALDKIYLIRAANIISHITADENVRGIEYFFAGAAQRMPVHMVLTATGECRISGVANVEEVI